MKKFYSLFFIIALAAISTACTSTKVVRGGDANLTPYLNTADADEVCKDIVGQVISSPRMSRFESEKGRAPIATVGKIKDETGEFFDTQIIANSLKTAILNSGVLEFMANKDVRDDMRGELVDQADHARADAAIAMDDEDAADYMLTGSVKLAVQNNGKFQERTYIVNIEVTDLRTHRTVGMFEPSDFVKHRLKKMAGIKSR